MRAFICGREIDKASPLLPFHFDMWHTAVIIYFSLRSFFYRDVFDGISREI